MPKPMDRFLHVYKSEFMKGCNKTGWGVITTAGAVFGGATALGGSYAALAASSALAVGTGGVALLALPFLYGIGKATIFKKNRQDMVKQEKMLSNGDFGNPMDWDCYWTSVAVVGYERTGKTQLKRRLRSIGELKDLPCPSTDNLEIHLSCLDADKKWYMALLDTVGATDRITAEQVDLIEIAAERARVIILVMDHADTERDGDDADLDQDRLTIQKSFIKQSLIDRVKKYRSGEGLKKFPLRAIMVVMNKADAWEKKSFEKKIRDWTEEQAKMLKDELRCDTIAYHLAIEDSTHPGYDRFEKDLTRYCGESQ